MICRRMSITQQEIRIDTILSLDVSLKHSETYEVKNRETGPEI